MRYELFNEIAFFNAMQLMANIFSIWLICKSPVYDFKKVRVGVILLASVGILYRVIIGNYDLFMPLLSLLSFLTLIKSYKNGLRKISNYWGKHNYNAGAGMETGKGNN